MLEPNEAGKMLKYRKSLFNQSSTSLLILAFVLTLSSCAAIYRSGFVSVPHQEISGSVTIGSEWTEIVPPVPLKPYATLQEVVLRFDDYDRKNFTDNLQGEILNLADGRKTKIEAFLFDDKGESYELQIMGTGGEGGGFTLSRKMIPDIANGNPNYKYLNFPTDRTYVKLKLRSEIPIKCDKIEWVCYNNK